MPNHKIQINLLRLQGAFVTNLRGATGEKRCLCIPIDDARLFLGEKGCYLDATAWEMRTPGSRGATHYIKQRFSAEVTRALSAEERRALPIIGDLYPRPDYGGDAPQPAPAAPAGPWASAAAAQETEAQLPF